jgi:hypothetical protein
MPVTCDILDVMKYEIVVADRGAGGHGFRRAKGEAMGSGGGTHDLGLPVAEPMTSRGRATVAGGHGR